MMITSFAFAFGPAGVQGAGFLELFGALDRLGGLYSIFIVREFAPLVVAIIVAGRHRHAVAPTSEPGRFARSSTRSACSASDDRRSIVVPRFLVIVADRSAVPDLRDHRRHGGRRRRRDPEPRRRWGRSSPASGTPPTRPSCSARTSRQLIFGFVIASVCCYKGLNGLRRAGRRRAAPSTRPWSISFLLIGAVDYLYGQLLLATRAGALGGPMTARFGSPLDELGRSARCWCLDGRARDVSAGGLPVHGRVDPPGTHPGHRLAGRPASACRSRSVWCSASRACTARGRSVRPRSPVRSPASATCVSSCPTPSPT